MPKLRIPTAQAAIDFVVLWIATSTVLGFVAPMLPSAARSFLLPPSA